MNVLIIVICAIAGTLLMTAFVYTIASVINKKWKVIKVLGTMLCNETTPGGGLSNSRKSITTGTVLHYGIGIVFAFFYHWLWTNHIGSPTMESAFVFGIINGIVGAFGWAVYFKFHKHPPMIQLKEYLLIIAVSHVLFATGFVQSYRWALNIFNT